MKRKSYDKPLQDAVLHDLLAIMTPDLRAAARLGNETLQGWLEAYVEDAEEMGIHDGDMTPLKAQIILSYQAGEIDWNKLALDLAD